MVIYKSGLVLLVGAYRSTLIWVILETQISLKKKKQEGKKNRRQVTSLSAKSRVEGCGWTRSVLSLSKRKTIKCFQILFPSTTTKMQHYRRRHFTHSHLCSQQYFSHFSKKSSISWHASCTSEKMTESSEISLNVCSEQWNSYFSKWKFYTTCD